MPVKVPYCVQCKHHVVEVTPEKVIKGRWWSRTYHIEERRIHLCRAIANPITGEPILRVCGAVRSNQGACGHSGKLFEDGTKEQT